MKKRMAFAALAGIALASGATGAQALTTMSSSSSWGCVVVDKADKSICLRDPLPERLPAPPTPSVPTV